MAPMSVLELKPEPVIVPVPESVLTMSINHKPEPTADPERKPAKV